jgi:signal recognition particle subunit SRP54
MFDNLSGKFQTIFRKLRGQGVISEQNVRDALREVRVALLEADVNFQVVKDFIDQVKAKAIGKEVLSSLTPSQQLIKIVHTELASLLGGEKGSVTSKIRFASSPPTCVILAGLQGSGKTTVAGKLAYYYKREGHKPLLGAADIYRPAATKQLEILGRQMDVPTYGEADATNPVEICRQAIAVARQQMRDLVFIDTAGRLQIEEEMMSELRQMVEAIHPSEVLLVVDAMTGQEAVNVALTFENQVGIDGVVLTKIDGDARGGAALSMVATIHKPIKFLGVGEKLDALEPFYPERMASRILGMGDVLTLVEKVGREVDEQKARELERKLHQAEFTFNDYREQLKQLRSMGSPEELVNLIPGVSNLPMLKNISLDEKQLGGIEAIINSMTEEERKNPNLIDGSRRKRIAQGSGTTVQDINRLLNQFFFIKKLMKQYATGRKLDGFINITK